MWWYSWHLKHLMLGQICAIYPCFRALVTMILFIGHHVDCRRWNNHGSELLCCIKLLTLEIASVSVVVLSHRYEYSDYGHSFNPLMNILMVAASFIKLHLLASIMNWWTICCKGFLFSLLDFHEVWGVSIEYQHCKALVITNPLFHPKICLS